MVHNFFPAKIQKIYKRKISKIPKNRKEISKLRRLRRNPWEVVIIVITWFGSGNMNFWQPLERPSVMIVVPPLRVGPTIMTLGRSAGCQKSISPSQITLLLYYDMVGWLVGLLFSLYLFSSLLVHFLACLFSIRNTYKKPSLKKAKMLRKP